MSKKRTRTAPKKPRGLGDETAKGELLRFRCTTEQRELFIAAAARAGLDVSNWLRHVALQAARGVSGADAKSSTPEKPRR